MSHARESTTPPSTVGPSREARVISYGVFAPNNALARAALAAQLVNGSGGPGMRPVIADTRFLQGELAIISVYCPDQLQKFQDYKDDLKSAGVAG